VKKLLGLTLGIVTALGGFVDLSQIVFTMQAGALFRFQLMWSVAIGLVAIIIYMEMCGRIAAVTKLPVFAVVRKRTGHPLGVFTLIISTILNLITCAAEIGGLGIILHLITGRNQTYCIVGASIVIGMVVIISRFQWIERTFGLSGLLMIVFALSAWYTMPDWPSVLRGLIPESPSGSGHAQWLYAYFAVGIFSAMLMEYEVYFYSSGAIEEEWTEEDLGENVLVASLGSTLGAMLTAALVVLGAQVFLPHSIFPDALSTTVIPASIHFGPSVMIVALVGMLACIGGAAIETTLCGSYNVCQFYDFPWGKNKSVRSTPLFTLLWIGVLATSTGIALTGVRPLTLVNIAVVFAMVAMPLTYYPILKAAGDHRLLGKHANGRVYQGIGWIFFGVIAVCAIAAVPLAVITSFGKP
jgi:manganese transport protein